MLENFFPNQFFQAKSREATVFASPTKSQTTKKLRSIKHVQTYSGAKDCPQFPHHIYTSNTN